MAQVTNVTIPAATWTQITNADVVTKITFQVEECETDVYLKVTAAATPPSDTTGAKRYSVGEGETGIALADLSPGVASGVRVFAYCPASSGVVSVSHD